MDGLMIKSRAFSRSALLLTAALAALPIAVSAQDAPLITITKSDRVALGINGISGPDGAGIAQTVQRDLQLSGVFIVGGPNTGRYQVSGASSGATLRGLLLERGGGTLLERSYSGSSRAQAHAFANDIVEAITGVRGIAGSRLGFVANRTGHKELYLVDADGSNQVQLTRDGLISVSPRLSADGRRIAYTGYQSGYADVYEIDLGSGSRRRIMKYPGTNSGAAYSPDGSRFAVTLSKDGNPELYVTNSSGDSPRRLTMTPGVESSPTWSPDGSEIIYSCDTGGSPLLYRISASGGSPSAIRTGYAYNTEPNWSPDGKKLAFTVRNGGSFQVAVVEFGTSGVRLLGEGQNPVWGPDSRHLAYAQGSSLVILDVVSQQRSSIVTGLGQISEPTWTR
ncbi:MAG: biopolymer transporter Tol [Verrucomicrobia bacterium]|nr:biopolymer transporter Tol [Verrucomicrobiota bacterium]